MSIFNRLISSLTGAEEAPVPAKAQTTSAARESRRFMGRDGGDTAAAVIEEKGFEAGATVWLHIQAQSQILLLVDDLGGAQGEELTPKKMADLERWGWCEEVVYHASYDQYWKMPSQTAIARMPSVYNIATPGPTRIKSSTQLVKQGEACGYWMRVRIRAPQEMPASMEATV